MSYQGEGKGTPTDTQTDRPDLTSTTLLRLILDYADSVEDAVALAQQYDVTQLPTLLFIKNGDIREKLVGFTHKLIIAENIKKLV